MVTFAVAIFFLLNVAAHSWVERVMRVELNGTMAGNPGFIRGTVSRLSADFTDFQMQHQLQGSPHERMCKESQAFNNYSDEFPALWAHPGDFIAIQYQENGHVTLPEITPQKADSGIVYVYGSSEPLEDPLLLSIHGVWTKNSNGDGRLLAKHSFDDGQCYQVNAGHESMARQSTYPKQPSEPQGADLWCQCDIRLPVDAQGVYTLYWVWDWPSSSYGHTVNEIYTSCLDIMLLPGIQPGALRYVEGQSVDMVGIEDQMRDVDF